MAVINNNEDGVLAINDAVISRLVIKHLMDYPDTIEPCNHKGKILRRAKSFDPVLYNCIEIKSNSTLVFIKFYFCIYFGKSLKEIANTLFDLIEADFEMLHMAKPCKLIASSKGTIIGNHINERNEHIVRINENYIR